MILKLKQTPGIYLVGLTDPDGGMRLRRVTVMP